MRQGQQNRRGRGRNNNSNSNGNGSGSNNRKSQNPLTRSFESSGPDVKVRGTPSHIAEKYISLARDALSSGDPVLAESYLQHAEHYNRIILTYREQQMSQGGEYQGALPRSQTFNAQDPMDGEDFGDDEAEDFGGNVQPQVAHSESQPQGGGEGGGQGGGVPQRSFDNQQRFDNRPQRHDNNRNDNRHNNVPQRHDRNDGNRFDRNDRQDNRGDSRNFNRNDRGPDRNQDRNQDRNHDRGPDRSSPDRVQGEPREFRDDRGQQGFGDGQGADSNGANVHRRRERFPSHLGSGGNLAGNGDRQPPAFVPQPPMPVQPPMPPVQAAPSPAPVEAEQPAFLRRPVRRPRRDDAEAAPSPRTPATDEQE